MFGKVFLLAVLLAGVNCRYLVVEEPLHFAKDGLLFRELRESLNSPQEILYLGPAYNTRVRRQAQTTLSIDGKTGNSELSAKIPIARSDSNVLSVIESQSAASRSTGLALDNINGHGLSIFEKTIPEFGKQLTAAGKVNILHTPSHDVKVNAFLTKTMPKIPEMSNFNTYGGGVDYTFNDKIGASVGVAQTDFLKKTDVNALGHLNLFRNKDTSFDFNAGATRSFSPFIPRSSWEPTYGFSFSKSW